MMCVLDYRVLSMCYHMINVFDGSDGSMKFNCDDTDLAVTPTSTRTYIYIIVFICFCSIITNAM